MVDWSRFANGASIDWRGFGEALLGGTVGLAVTTIVALVRNWFEATISLIDGLASYVTTVVATLAGAPGEAFATGWTQTAAFVGTFGPLGLVAAITVVLGSFWLVAQEVELLG